MKKIILFIVIVLSIIGCNKYRKIYRLTSDENIRSQIIHQIDSVLKEEKVKFDKIVYCGHGMSENTIEVILIDSNCNNAIVFVYNNKYELISVYNELLDGSVYLPDGHWYRRR